MLSHVLEIEKPLHQIEIEDLASESFDVSRQYSEQYQYAKDRTSFMIGFCVACDIFTIMGINPNVILKYYKKELLAQYLSPTKLVK